MKIILFLTLFFFLKYNLDGQTVNLNSFQHSVRWVSESNFPPYIKKKNIQDTILKVAVQELEKHFKTDQVIIPPSIEYKYISGFGKANIHPPVTSKVDDNYQISILSLLTRSTVGYGVNWKMKIVVNKNGNTVYNHETEHELEYFSSTGYLSTMPWFTEESFIKLYQELLGELLENREPLAAKIIVGSPEEKEMEVKKLIANPVRLMLKSQGNFLQGSNFIMSLYKEKDSLVTIIYRDGLDVSAPTFNMSGIAASFLRDITGLTIGYNSKSKEIKNGRIQYAGGREIRLRMEWVVESEKTTDGNTEAAYLISPMVAEAFDQNKELAHFIFSPENAVLNLTQTSFLIYRLQGEIENHSVKAEFNPQSGLVEITENGKIKVVVVMQNLNTNSNSFSSSKISKNKKIMSSGGSSIGKPHFKEPEWYPFFHEPDLPELAVLRYMDVLLILFFGMGNHF